MGQQKVVFPNASGEQLAGLLHTPARGDARACVLFAHCFTCTKNIRAAAHISRALADAGFAVLRFDFTGLGESEGEFGRAGLSANVADLIAAARFLDAEVAAPALLVGHSLGGLAVLYAAPRIPACVAVATLGAPARAAHVQRQFAGRVDEIRSQGEARVDIGGRPFRLSRDFLEDLQHEPPDLADLGRALLIMHSPVDSVVGIDNASTLFQAARHPKSFVSLDRADHLLGEPEDAAYAAAVIAAWATRYLPEETADETVPGDGVVASTGSGGFLTHITAGAHRLLADEPAAVGGDDAGPSPYDLLSAALASCTSMTLQMYARRKGLKLDRATVTVRHGKIHAQDCESCETKSGRIDRFDREVRLDGELSDDERRRLMEIADKCPVHRTLHGDVEIR